MRPVRFLLLPLALPLLPVWLLDRLAARPLERSLAGHLARRYLRRRRTAWLALAAVTLTVAVPIVAMGVMQGWIDVTRRQVRAAEADLTVDAWGRGIVYNPEERETLLALPMIAGAAPFIEDEAIITPSLRRRDERAEPNYFCRVDGVDWELDLAMGRKRLRDLHPRPSLDLGASPLAPDERGSAFLSPRWRAHLVLAGTELVAGLGCMPLPPPPRFRPRPGAILGREMLYQCGGLDGPLRPGTAITLTIPNGSGGRVGAVTAEVADTIGVGAYELDRYQAVLPLPLAQRLCDFDGRNPRAEGRKEITGYRLRLAPGHEPEAAVERLHAITSLSVLTWRQRRGNLVKSLEIQRNLLGLVMILVQLTNVFIVFAVFTTMVAEKRHDIGALLGMGASGRSITAAFLLAAGGICLFGGLLGWVLGWGALAGLNPISEFFNVPLFPQAVIYTPEAPISWNPLIPLLFIGVITVVGLLSAACPALRAGRIDPVETLRDNG